MQNRLRAMFCRFVAPPFCYANVTTSRQCDGPTDGGGGIFPSGIARNAQARVHQARWCWGNGTSIPATLRLPSVAAFALEVLRMSVQPTIHRRTLHDELVTLLRNMIIEGELRPGSRIAESRLCTHFGVS